MSKVLFVGDAPGGNYEERVRQFIEDHDLGPGHVHRVNVTHDDECSIFDRKPCDCDPDISLRAEA